jgi:hypothetical protein
MTLLVLQREQFLKLAASPQLWQAMEQEITFRLDELRTRREV